MTRVVGLQELSWGARQRLEFIEFRALWEGGVNRSDITERFGVSVPQASSDLGLYQKMAPENLRYDSRAKRYVAAEDFSPRLIEARPDKYLDQLRAAGHEVRDEDLARVSPLAHAHVIPNGSYFQSPRRRAQATPQPAMA